MIHSSCLFRALQREAALSLALLTLYSLGSSLGSELLGQGRVQDSAAKLARKRSVGLRIISNYRLAVDIEIPRLMQASQDSSDNRQLVHIPELAFRAGHSSLIDYETGRYNSLSPGVTKLLRIKLTQVLDRIAWMELNDELMSIEEGLLDISERLLEHEKSFGADAAKWNQQARKDLFESFDRLMILYWFKKDLNSLAAE